MTHIHGQRDTDLHDEHGNHVKPEYKAPAETEPGNPEHAASLGLVVRGSSLEKAELDYRRALARYNSHLDAHDRETT